MPKFEIIENLNSTDILLGTLDAKQEELLILRKQKMMRSRVNWLQNPEKNHRSTSVVSNAKNLLIKLLKEFVSRMVKQLQIKLVF